MILVKSSQTILIFKQITKEQTLWIKKGLFLGLLVSKRFKKE